MNLDQSKSKVQWWRIILILGFIVAFGMINFGCQCDCEEAPDEYYVKYEVNCSGLVGSPIAEIIVSSENGDLTFNLDHFSPWETTIGPVQKGFNATLKVNVTNAVVLLYGYIHVSKNDSPFALKASDGSESINDPISNVQLSYTIDY
ncbi:MAG: hypothetical protein JXR56_00735 [Candidatus Cloacimonetes bacterium]|nr:hypothetical protein [Candidatus Cloacimonadota bacterium]